MHVVINHSYRLRLHGKLSGFGGRVTLTLLLLAEGPLIREEEGRRCGHRLPSFFEAIYLFPSTASILYELNR
jgi:hypothetical protein